MKIQRTAVVLLMVMLLITAFACSGGSDQGSTTTWTTYSNSSLGFSIQYPQDWTWTAQEGNENGVVFIPSSNSALAFLTVYNLSIHQSETLSDYVGELTQMLGEAGISPESSATILDGIPAHKLVYAGGSEQQGTIKAIDIIAIKNSRVYTIQYMADEGAYLVYLKTAQQMMDSFKFD